MRKNSNSLSQIKKTNLNLDSEKFFLRPIKYSDATKEYLNWLNSKEINQFLESRFTQYTKQNLNDYLDHIINDPNSLLMTIIEKTNHTHIGNIKIGPINWNHKFAEIGIIIGNEKYWGKGYASEAIKLLSDFGFKKLNLHKISAGAYSNNYGSIKAFLKAGFFEEYKRSKHYLYNKKYVDGVFLSKFS